MINHITLLATEHMLSSSVAMPMEMLEAARAQLRRQRRNADFHIQLASNAGEPLSALGGVKLRPHCKLTDIEQTDLIIIPALWRNPQAVLRHETAAFRWIQQQYGQGAAIAAIGTGACLLAETGLLDGKPATTHWHYLTQFARDYPQVLLQKEHLLTQSGRLYCAASISSGADMMVHLIAQLLGHDIGQLVEQQFSPEARQPFDQSVYIAEQATQHPDEVIADLQTWLQRHFQQPLDLELLANRAGMSVRQLDRRFKQVTNTTPGQYLQRLRMQQAKELLKNSNLMVVDIAMAVGYQDASYFGRIFRREHGQSPSAYRQKVRRKLFHS